MSPEHFKDWLEQYQSLSHTAFEKPLIMGVLNVTSDSFSDGGVFLSADKASEHALNLVDQGADIIDIGGESTRPGAMHVPLDMELERVIPVIEHIRKNTDCCISIDTYKPEVMKAAIQAGANIINDIYALRQKGSLEMAAELGVPVCLMHMQGQPNTMQDNPQYSLGILKDIEQFFSERINACIAAGLDKKQLIVDPGFGFGKLVQDNLRLIHHLDALGCFSLPVLLGASRKSTIGALLGNDVDERLIGSISFAIYAALKGASILRVHDVYETNQALTLITAINQADAN